MREHENACGPVPSPEAAKPADCASRLCLGLVCELEDSLRSSQTALLARDVAAIERCTQEQVRLWRALKSLPLNLVSQGTASAAEEYRQEVTSRRPALAGQLHAAAIRVQHLARIQAALLRRSQQFLCVLANWMAGPETPYGPPDTPCGGSFCGPAEADQGF
jgi:hypothetical protein